MILKSANRFRVRIPVIFLASFAVWGCGENSGGGGRAPDTSAASWRLAGEAGVTIGGSAGPGQELYRVYGGLIAPGGKIVLGNSGTGEVRVFDPAGRFLSATGRQGRGPGEFTGINWMAPTRADSILVYDLRAQRFSVLDPAGAFVRSFRSALPPGSSRPLGVFSDGSVLVAVENRYDPRGDGVVRDTLVLHRVSPEGAVLATVGRFPGAEWLRYEHAASFRVARLPFGAAGHVAVAGDHVVYGSSDAGRLRVHDREGRVVREIALPGAPRALDRREVSDLLESSVPDEVERNAIRRHYDGTGEARAPVFSALRADREGRLWVQLAPEAESDSARWAVFTLQGEEAGSVRLPRGFFPLDVLGGWLLLRETDAEGTERVSVREVGR